MNLENILFLLCLVIAWYTVMILYFETRSAEQNVVSSSLAFFVRYYKPINPVHLNYINGEVNLQKEQRFEKVFLYLVQTEACIPEYLQSLERLGDSSLCKCEVLILSFKAKCKKVFPRHIRHIYISNTTWASGRNELFFIAMKTKPSFLYYVFMDDDVVLKYSERQKGGGKRDRVTTEGLENKPGLPPFRAFENFLLDFEPAVGVPDYVSQNTAAWNTDVRKACKAILDLNYLPVVLFDPLFSAYHEKAIRHLLPYPESYDSRCWWHAHRFVETGIEVKFPGQAVLFPDVVAFNELHRSYPDNDTGMEDVWRDFIEEARLKAPKPYQNHVVFDKFKHMPLWYSLALSPTFCMNITRHENIIPYTRFEKHIYTADIQNISALYELLPKLYNKYVLHTK